MAESIFDLIYGEDRFKKPQTGLMSSFDDTDYGDLTAQPEKDYLQEMKTRDKIALLTSAMPVVGGITGTYADAMNMIENPEERTLANAGLMALNWIPTGRGAREGMRMADDSYRVQHQVANPKDYPDESIRLDDLTKSITGEQAGYPADFYTPRGQQIYAPSQRFDDDIYGMANNESYNAILKAKNNPDATVTIYRGVPKGVDKINEGDWVSLSPTYAREHASTGYGRSGDEAGEVISQEVKVKDIYWGGDDVNEFGYFPQSKDSGVLANITTKNVDEVKPENAFRPYNYEDPNTISLVGRNKFGLENDEFQLEYLTRGEKLTNYENTSDDWYNIIDKSTGKEVGQTRLVRQRIDDKEPITGLINIMIDDKNKGMGTKFINSMKKSSKADPYSVSPQLEVYDITPDGKKFWNKVGAKEYYSNREHIGGQYGKIPRWDIKAGEIKANTKPKPVKDDYKGRINTILDWRE